MRSIVVVAVVLGITSTVRADVPADVARAFTAFVANAASEKPDLRGVELFLTPADQSAPLPGAEELKALHKILPAPKVSGVKVVVAKSGTSAWLVADLSARLTPQAGEKPRAGTVRASAVLALDAKGWQMRAAHWSVAAPNRNDAMCGDRKTWSDFQPSVPGDVHAPVKAVWDALSSGKSETALVALLSDDATSLAIGSAPGERWTGGPAIKKLFGRLSLMSWSERDDVLDARAGATGDGELIWMVLPVAPMRYCTFYRTLYVLQRQAGGWKIVHQHYSEDRYDW